MKRSIFIFVLSLFVGFAGCDLLYAQKAEKKQAEKEKKELETIMQAKMYERQKNMDNIVLALQKLRQEQITLSAEYAKLKNKSNIEFTPEFEKSTMKLLEAQNAQKAYQISMLKSKQFNKYKQALEDYYISTDMMDKLKESDPKRYEQLKKKRDLEEKSRKYAEEYRMTSVQKEKNKHKAELKTVLNELFDLRELDREEEMKKLNQKLNDLMKVMSERNKKKNDIVERRLNQLLGEVNELVW